MSELVIFEMDGQQVAFDPKSEMWSLTAMHQAVEAPSHKAPAQWLRQDQTQEYVVALLERVNVCLAHIYHRTGAEVVPVSLTPNEMDQSDRAIDVARQMGLIVTRLGRYDGGTWAHWQIAAAYAHYLSPRFYLQWNEWAMAYRTGQQNSPTVAQFMVLTAQVDALATEVGALKARIPPISTQLRVETSAIDVSSLHPQAQAIIAALAAAGGGPLTSQEILQALQRARVEMTQPSQVRVRLRRMAERGQCAAVGGAPMSWSASIRTTATKGQGRRRRMRISASFTR